MDELEFQKKVLDGVDQTTAAVKAQGAQIAAIQTKQEQLLSNYDQLDKGTKKLMEDFTLLKNAANDQAGILAKLQRLQIALQHESRMAFGDPIQRISSDPEKRLAFNALVRRAVLASGERLPERFAKALGEDTSPGSIGVMDALERDIYSLLETYGAWPTLDARSVMTKTTKIPIKTARAVALVILTEAGEIADDANKAGTSVDCVMEVIACLLNVSFQLLQDSEYDVTSDVMQDFGDAFGYRMDYLAFRADGTADATNGGMTGLFNFGTAAMAAAGNVACEDTNLDDWIRCLTTVNATVLTRPAKWWIHPQMLVRSLGVKDANKRPIFQTALEAPSPGAIGSILGYPTVPTQVAPTANAANAKLAVFGDPYAMAVRIRSDWTFEASDHHRWNYLQRSFRGYGRGGVKGRLATAASVLTLPAA